jgi:hypothetical protein
MRFLLGAAGAWGQCAPAPPAGVVVRPLSFTVSWRREAQPGCLTPVYTCAYTPLCGWYEWDPAKAATNLAKHKVHFADARSRTRGLSRCPTQRQ